MSNDELQARIERLEALLGLPGGSDPTTVLARLEALERDGGGTEVILRPDPA